MDADLVVFVPTYRRPALLRDTLDSLGAQAIDRPFLVVVADNDVERAEGLAAAEAWAAERGWQDRIRAVPAAGKGISACRNAGLAAALAAAPAARAVAMVDDDATADPDWLAHAAEVLDRFDADVVGGPVIFSFPEGTPDWLAHSLAFQVKHDRTGLVDSVAGAGNCTLSRRILEAVGPDPFDLRFGQSGGEDVDFFERCRRHGARFAWANDAIVREFVPANRATPEWVLQRFHRAGNTNAQMALKYKGRGEAVVQQIGRAARELLGGTLRLATARGPHAEARKFRGRINLAHGTGRLSGLRGKTLRLY